MACPSYTLYTKTNDDPAKPWQQFATTLSYFSWNIPSSAPREFKPFKRVEVYAVHVLDSLQVAASRFQGAEGTDMYPQGQYMSFFPDNYANLR